MAHDVKGDLIGDVILLSHGRPDKGMPAMPLTDQQVSDLAAYFACARRQRIDNQLTFRRWDIPFSKPLTGS